MKTNPQYRADYLQRESEYEQRLSQLLTERRVPVVYTIPVVVHVFHLGESPGQGSNISDLRINDVIDAVNDIYRNRVGSSVDVSFEFCLAVRDPNGNPTSGINRVDASSVPLYATYGVAFDTLPGVSDADLISLGHWPSDQYFNIWVVHNINGRGVAGYAGFLWGTVIDDDWMDANYALILAHELGHGLSLGHTFSGDGNHTYCPVDTNCQSNGDKVCDTPPHKTYDCGNSNPCTVTQSDWDNSRKNYMSYCHIQGLTLDRFTQGQKDRIIVNLQSKVILNSQGCVSSTCASACNDGNVCTIDICDNGNCVYQPILCNDNSACTTDTCMDGICDFIELVCNDGNATTFDYCRNGSCLSMPYVTGSSCESFDEFPNCGNNIYECVANGSCDSIFASSGWQNSPGDDIDWSLSNVASHSSDSGPDQDHTSGSGSFLFTVSWNCYNNKAELLSPAYILDSIPNPRLQFWYHMFGDHMGTLSVDVTSLGSGTWTNLWSLSGNQDSLWHSAMINLSNYSNDTVRFRFTGVTGYFYLSEMAIDDICVSSGCLNVTECNDGELCTTDSCASGICINAAIVCHDNDTCTLDFCDNGLCINELQAFEDFWRLNSMFNFYAPNNPNYRTIGFSTENKGYILTGTSGSSIFKEFWEYDPATTTWTRKADFGGDARNKATGFSINGKVYVGTGSGGPYYKDFWEYDPVADMWTQKADVGGTARNRAVGFSIGGKGYIGTGYYTSAKKDFWEYDPLTNVWTQKTDFAGVARYYAVGFSIGNKGYIGTGYGGGYKNDFWEFDPYDLSNGLDANGNPKGKWTQKADFGGNARELAVGFSIGSNGYIGTGSDTSDYKDFWEYDPFSNSWTQKNNFGGDARAGAAGFSIGNRGYIGMGGMNNGYGIGNTTMEFWEYTKSCANLISLQGKIVSEIGQPVTGVTLALNGQNDTQTIVTTSDGLYDFEVPYGENCTITPSKNNEITTNNGITTLDMILIQKQILVIAPLNTPYKKIAADVNGSNSVTTLDIVFIRSVILQIDSFFPNERLWAFVPDDYVLDTLNPFSFPISRTYNNLISNLTAQDYIGIKLGDVNNTWNPNTAKSGAVGEVTFVINKQEALPSQEITVPIMVRDFTHITGYQFTLSWNPKVLTLLEVTSQSLTGYYGMHKTSEGYLTTSWNDEMAKAVTLDDDAVAFELKFKVIGASGTRSEIKTGSEITMSEAYNVNLDLLNIVPTSGLVKVGDGVNRFHPSQGWNLSVQPNPFTNITNIIFSIPKDETVSIVIYDLLGKEIKHLKSDYKAGDHKIEWAGDNDAGKSLYKGLYHVRMIAGEHILSTKAVMMR